MTFRASRKRTIQPTPNPTDLRAIHPNAGIEAWYRRKMDAEIKAMQDSITYWLTANYRKTGLAQDDSPAVVMREAMKKLTKHWHKVFDNLATGMAKRLAEKVMGHSDRMLDADLKGAGFAVPFKMTKPMNDAFQATVGENVNLIKSIASEHLSDVEGIVMRSVARGRDLGAMAKDLQHRFGVTKRRAALIARDQNNKATSVMQAARQKDIGITEGIWKHSHAGKQPRPSHLKADGKKFDLSKGMYLDGEWVMPGQAINCLPGTSQVEFAAGCKKLWRRRYTGELTTIVTDAGEIVEATPNHPVLTRRGWIPIRYVNPGEDVFSVSEKIGNVIENNVDDGYSSIAEAFDLAALYIGSYSTPLSGLEFHRDAPNGEVDTVDIEGFLPDEFDAKRAQAICESFLSDAYMPIVSAGLSVDCSHATALHRLFGAPQSVVRGFCAVASLLRSHASHADAVRLRLASRLHACELQTAPDDRPADAIRPGKSELAFSSFVTGDDFLIRQFMGLISAASVRWWGNPASAEMLGNGVFVDAGKPSGSREGMAFLDHPCRVVDKRSRDFDGHVYNLETSTNWYSVQGLIYHNCRCTWAPVIPGFDS